LKRLIQISLFEGATVLNWHTTVFISGPRAIFAQLVHDMDMPMNSFIVIKYFGPSCVFAMGNDYAGIFCDEKGFELY
jgi:hypothetical protein